VLKKEKKRGINEKMEETKNKQKKLPKDHNLLQRSTQVKGQQSYFCFSKFTFSKITQI
jgi:hypothetical protein